MLRQALSESGKKILVHAFPGDSIYGAGYVTGIELAVIVY